MFKGRWSNRNPDFNDDFSTFVAGHMVKGLDSFTKDYHELALTNKISKIPKLPYESQIRGSYRKITQPGQKPTQSNLFE